MTYDAVTTKQPFAGLRGSAGFEPSCLQLTCEHKLWIIAPLDRVTEISSLIIGRY